MVNCRIIINPHNREVEDMRCTINKEIKNQVFELFYQGYYVWEIARMLDISECAVVHILNKDY